MIKILLTFVVFAWSFVSLKSLATPAEVILIRHAEKPSDPNAIDLSPEGYQRAAALAHLFEGRPELVKNGLPIALYASAYVPGTNSKRTIETITPLSEAIHVSIDSTYTKEGYDKLAKTILTHPAFEGKTVMIAWVQGYIVELAKSLGSSPANKWDVSVFDRIWLIHYSAGGNVNSEDVPQKLLPGDSQ